MKVFHLQGHYESCNHKDWCFTNTTLLMVKGEFIVIEYQNCLELSSHIDFNLALVKQILKRCSHTELSKVEKSIALDKSWSNQKKREMIYNSKHREVNYIYANNAGKLYSINSLMNFGEAVEIQERLDSELNDVIDYLQENNLQHLIENAKDLHRFNFTYQLRKDEYIVRAIDEIVTNIKQQI